MASLMRYSDVLMAPSPPWLGPDDRRSLPNATWAVVYHGLRGGVNQRRGYITGPWICALAGNYRTGLGGGRRDYFGYLPFFLGILAGSIPEEGFSGGGKLSMEYSWGNFGNYAGRGCDIEHGFSGY